MPSARVSCLFQPKLIKGHKLQYCKGLIASMKNNHVWVRQSFTVRSRETKGDKALKHHALQPGHFIYWKRPLQQDSLQPHWKGPYQLLLTNPCATKLQGIDSCIHVRHLKKAPNADWTCTSSGDLKVKISWNWSRWHLMRQLPKDVQIRPVGILSAKPLMMI